MIIIRLNPGDDVLATLTEAAKQNDIKNAVIVSAFGSTQNHHFHVVTTPDLPPVDAFVKEEKASDIISITGAIINGRVHAHITHSDTEIAYGGHLEPGVRVLTFLNIFLAEVDFDFNKFDSIGKIEELRG